MSKPIADKILKTLHQHDALNAQEIKSYLTLHHNLNLEISEINSTLYGDLHDYLIRDKDTNGYPTWRLKTKNFQAPKGLEVLFYDELIKHNIINTHNSSLDYTVTNHHNGKTYHLDIAIINGTHKYNIEIDGFEHIRADARLSIQNQLQKRSQSIDIDWMDNNNSFADFNQINNNKIFKWLNQNKNWTIKYHEELLKPHDITRNIWLIDNGWQIIRFWNFQIKEDLKNSLNITKTWLSK